jgi:hypothetical protein
VDEGPLRDLSNPANSEFVNRLMEGYIPEELMKKRKEEGKRAMLNVNIADKRTEDYR